MCALATGTRLIVDGWQTAIGTAVGTHVIEGGATLKLRAAESAASRYPTDSTSICLRTASTKARAASSSSRAPSASTTNACE